MSPSAVDAALLAAPGFFASHFADQVDWGIDWIFCMSWLLDPQLVNLLPGSNIADFASRWEVIGGEAQDRDGYYFVFNIEPEPDQTLPLGLDDLPQRSSLERALVSHWRSGGHLVRAHGRIPAGRSRTG